jgi:hypothetical protein
LGSFARLVALDDRRWTRKGADEIAKIEAQQVVRRIQNEADAIRGTADDVVIDIRSPGAKFEKRNKAFRQTERLGP